jgi:hypothetical protein
MANIQAFPAADLTIGGLARRTGCNIPTIRYCERIGLLAALAGEPDWPCADADPIASAQLESVKSKIAGLKLLQKEQERMLLKCAHGTISDCRVVETLGDHALCNMKHNRW